MYAPILFIFLFNIIVCGIVWRTLYTASKKLGMHALMVSDSGSHIRDDTIVVLDEHGGPVKQTKVKVILSAPVRHYLMKYSMYIVVFFAIWLWGAIQRLQEQVNPNNPVYSITFLNAVSISFFVFN